MTSTTFIRVKHCAGYNRLQHGLPLVVTNKYQSPYCGPTCVETLETLISHVSTGIFLLLLHLSTTNIHASLPPRRNKTRRFRIIRSYTSRLNYFSVRLVLCNDIDRRSSFISGRSFRGKNLLHHYAARLLLYVPTNRTLSHKCHTNIGNIL